MPVETVAADGKTKIINVPGHPLMVSAVDFNNLVRDYQRLLFGNLSNPPKSLMIMVATEAGSDSYYESRTVPHDQLKSATFRPQIVSDIANDMVTSVLEAVKRLEEEAKTRPRGVRA